jgi:hypothetical protein
MATYKITCVTREGDAPHDHVVSIGIGPHTTLSVADVRERLDHADVYYTYGGEKSAVVEKHDCECGAATIKSVAEATAENDLHSVPAC